MDNFSSNIKLKYDSLRYLKIVKVNKIDKTKAINPPSRIKFEKNDPDSKDPLRISTLRWWLLRPKYEFERFSAFKIFFAEFIPFGIMLGIPDWRE